MRGTGTEIIFRADGNFAIGPGHIVRSEVVAANMGRHDVFSPREMVDWCGRLLGDRELRQNDV